VVIFAGVFPSQCFCCISTGIFGYPNEDAAHVALQTVRKWLETDDNVFKVRVWAPSASSVLYSCFAVFVQLDRVVFCCFLGVDCDIYTNLLQFYFPVGDDEDVVGECLGDTPAAACAADSDASEDGPDPSLRRNFTAISAPQKRERSVERDEEAGKDSELPVIPDKVTRSSTV
jgi:hypothetical protein